MTLENKSAIVTGGTRGIGRAIAQMLVNEGARVVVCGRSQESAEKAARELGPNASGCACNVADPESVSALFRFADDRLGGLDILINNAGVGIFRPAGELSVEEWRAVIDTNLNGVFFCSREALPRFESRGSGYIVNISSLAATNAFPSGSAYNASKFALTGFSEAMMQDVRSANIRVSYVMPGSVATEFGRNASAEAGRDWKIWPEDVAAIARMLLTTPARTLISRVEVRPAKPPKK
jgi:NAD(P)-dependent dehydrogenase (short-subunit alcohol dehydrogenase family)